MQFAERWDTRFEINSNFLILKYDQIAHQNYCFADREFLDLPQVSYGFTGEAIEEGVQLAVTCRVKGS